MSITFSTDTDDSGAGVDGTVHNNAWKQAMATVINTAFVGAGTTYTPAWTSSGTAPAIGNGTITGRYWQMDKFLAFAISVTFGSTSTFGTGFYSFSLPFTANNTTEVGTAVALDSSAGTRWSGAWVFNTTTTVSIAVAGPAGSTQNWGQLVPFTWATSDTINISAFYERT